MDKTATLGRRVSGGVGILVAFDGGMVRLAAFIAVGRGACGRAAGEVAYLEQRLQGQGAFLKGDPQAAPVSRPAAANEVGGHRRLERPRKARHQDRRAGRVTPGQQGVQANHSRGNRRGMARGGSVSGGEILVHVLGPWIKVRIDSDSARTDLERMDAADVGLAAGFDNLQFAPVRAPHALAVARQVNHRVHEVIVQLFQSLGRIELGSQDRGQAHFFQIDQKMHEPRARLVAGKERPQMAERIDHDPARLGVLDPIGDIDQQAVFLPARLFDHFFGPDEFDMQPLLFDQSLQVPAERGRIGVKLFGHLLESQRHARLSIVQRAGDQHLQAQGGLA